MKKLVLVLVCVLIMTIFIAFNYLLWDRENKIKNIENLNTSKNMSIDTLGDKIKNLDDANKQLAEEIKKLEGEKGSLTERYQLLEQELTVTKDNLKQKNVVLNQLKRLADIKALEQVVKKWVESIDAGKYDEAYKLQIKQLASPENNISLDSFANIYVSNIKNIKIKSIKLYEDDMSAERQGDIVFEVSLDVKKAENAKDSVFKEGLNERYFVVGYDETTGEWIIDNISEVP